MTRLSSLRRSSFQHRSACPFEQSSRKLLSFLTSQSEAYLVKIASELTESSLQSKVFGQWKVPPSQIPGKSVKLALNGLEPRLLLLGGHSGGDSGSLHEDFNALHVVQPAEKLPRP